MKNVAVRFKSAGSKQYVTHDVGTPAFETVKLAPMENTPHILIVEDDRETRELIARYLQGRSFRVTGARFLQLPIERVEHVALAELEQAAA